MNLKIDLEKLARAKSCGAAIDEHTHPNLLTKREADDWINLLVDNSKLLKDIRVIRTDKCKGEIPRLDLNTIVSEGANAKTCITERRVQDSYLTYDMVKYRSGTSISQDFLDCNVFQEGIRNEVVNMLRTQVGNDMEQASIEGDSTLPVGDHQSDYNNLMGVNDGFIALAKCCVPQCQIIDAQGAGPSTALYMALRKRLPPRYRQRRGNYRYVVGPQLFDQWVETRAGRLTAWGDEAMRTGQGGPLWGQDLYEVPLWPENLPCGSEGAETTVVMYTPLDNLVYFIQREMSLEWERRIRCDDYQATMYWKADFALMNPDAVVLAVNVDPCGTAWTGCDNAPCESQRTNCPGCDEE
jgi:hypothetical protein